MTLRQNRRVIFTAGCQTGPKALPLILSSLFITSSGVRSRASFCSFWL